MPSQLAPGMNLGEGIQKKRWRNIALLGKDIEIL